MGYCGVHGYIDFLPLTIKSQFPQSIIHLMDNTLNKSVI